MGQNYPSYSCPKLRGTPILSIVSYCICNDSFIYTITLYLNVKELTCETHYIVARIMYVCVYDVKMTLQI